MYFYLLLSFVQNPGYMKEHFVIMIESFHIDDVGNQHNVCIKIKKEYFILFFMYYIIIF